MNADLLHVVVLGWASLISSVEWCGWSMGQLLILGLACCRLVFNLIFHPERWLVPGLGWQLNGFEPFLDWQCIFIGTFNYRLVLGFIFQTAKWHTWFSLLTNSWVTPGCVLGACIYWRPEQASALFLAQDLGCVFSGPQDRLWRQNFSNNRLLWHG